MCEKRGLAVQTLRLESAPPIVVADLVAPGAKRTIAFYAHYDGQPVDAKQWKSDPWKASDARRRVSRSRLARGEID